MRNYPVYKPIPDHPYHGKTISELLYIVRDAGEAAVALRGFPAEFKYLDQVNDACTVLGYRLRLQDLAEKENLTR